MRPQRGADDTVGAGRKGRRVAMTWSLEEAIVAFARALPSTQVDDAARVIEHAPDPAAARPLLLALVPNARYQDQACRLLDAWAGQATVAGSAVAVGVPSSARAANAEGEVQRLELVWT